MLSPSEVYGLCDSSLLGRYRKTCSAVPGPTAVFNPSDFPLHPHLSQQESFCPGQALLQGKPPRKLPGVLVKKSGSLGLNPCSASK